MFHNCYFPASTFFDASFNILYDLYLYSLAMIITGYSWIINILCDGQTCCCLPVQREPQCWFVLLGHHDAWEEESLCVFVVCAHFDFARSFRRRSRSPKAILISAPITFLKWAKSQYFIRTLIPAFKLLMKKDCKDLEIHNHLKMYSLKRKALEAKVSDNVAA